MLRARPTFSDENCAAKRLLAWDCKVPRRKPPKNAVGAWLAAGLGLVRCWDGKPKQTNQIMKDLAGVPNSMRALTSSAFGAGFGTSETSRFLKTQRGNTESLDLFMHTMHTDHHRFVSAS
eukprot:s724_g10.t1